jgi:hypothetical protein
MHPDVCRFISEIVYDGRLHGIPELARQTTAFGTGCASAGRHSGQRRGVLEEASGRAEIAAMVARRGPIATARSSLCASATSWSSRRTTRRSAGFASVARAGLTDVPVGTVDKFQGREARWCSTRWRRRASRTFRAASSSCSRATGSTSRSRARCASRDRSSQARRLLESHARTIEQMRLINALCRFVELDDEQERELRRHAARPPLSATRVPVARRLRKVDSHRSHPHSLRSRGPAPRLNAAHFITTIGRRPRQVFPRCRSQLLQPLATTSWVPRPIYADALPGVRRVYISPLSFCASGDAGRYRTRRCRPCAVSP